MKKNLLVQIDFNTLRGAFPSGSLPAKENLSIGDIISKLLPYLFVLAGLGLLVFLILGGFQLMVSGGDPKATEQAKGKITGAVIGFIIIFISYWLVQILQVVFGLPKVF